MTKEFKKTSISEDFVIIAPGVSNSEETKAEEFLREEI